jgi:hypothetical protein
MDGACSTYMREKRCIHDFGEDTRRKETKLEVSGMDEKKILKWIFDK